ncbi:MAG: cytochrome c [Gammaproteobacteria bacterium]|nr:cytochrome c [Gammaproteobacteria bacterium]
MKTTLLSAVVLALSGLPSAALAAGDAEQGRLRAQTCMGCHGAPGMRNAYPGYRVPKLGGQHTQYLMDALNAYQQRLRSHPTMQAQAADLSDEDIANLAAYFSQLGNRR